MTVASLPLIDPKIDIYGSDGRTAALADLVEVRAINGVLTTAADLADLVADMGWTNKPLRLIEDGKGDEERPESLANQAFTLISDRTQYLAEKYPFTFKLGSLVSESRETLMSSPYFAILSVAIAHAWKFPTVEKSPELIFESLVTEALRDRMTVVQFGTSSDMQGTFPTRLRESAEAIGLSASPNPVPRRLKARDAGVDTLGGHIWKDGRRGHWVFLGQATCGKTDTWSSKLSEPQPSLWREYLQEPLTPQRFLAVPHHVDARFMDYLHKQDQGLLLDRIRLSSGLKSPTQDSLPLMEQVLGAGIG